MSINEKAFASLKGLGEMAEFALSVIAEYEAAREYCPRECQDLCPKDDCPRKHPKASGQPVELPEFNNQAEFELSLFLLNNFRIAVEPALLRDICDVIERSRKCSNAISV